MKRCWFIVIIIYSAACQPAPANPGAPTPTVAAIRLDDEESDEFLADCFWDGTAQVWWDLNEDGQQDADEPPLFNVLVLVDDTGNNLTGVGGDVTNVAGAAFPSVWMPGCPEVTLEVYVLPPDGYHATTPARLPVTDMIAEASFQFGLAYRPGITPTPRPVGSLDCQLVATIPEIIWGIERGPDGSVMILHRNTQSQGATLEQISAGGTINAMPVPSAAGVSAFAVDDAGRFWIGNHALIQGAYSFDGVQWALLDETNGLISNEVHDIRADSAGNIWFGTSLGISRYRPDSGEWQSYTPFTAAPGPENAVRWMALGPDGSLWAANAHHGLVRLQPDPAGGPRYQATVVLGREDEAVPIYNYVGADVTPDGAVWLAGAGGAARYDSRSAEWTVYSRASVPELLHDPTSMALAPDGTVWLGLGPDLLQLTPGHGATPDQWLFYHPEIMADSFAPWMRFDSAGALWLGLEGREGRVVQCRP